jgi:peptidoglycan/LPS O-acetylase OafA/YrhL
LVTRIFADAFGLVAIAGVVLLATRVKFETPAMFERGGLTGVALLAGVIVHAIVVDPGGVCASVLRLPPLVFIGKISYSLYLWHWPVIFATAPVEPQWSFPVVTAIRVALSFGLATLSYFVVERLGRSRPSPASSGNRGARRSPRSASPAAPSGRRRG